MLKESRERNAPYITSLKVQGGQDKKEAIEDVMKDALEGGVGIDAVTKSVDKVLEGKKK